MWHRHLLICVLYLGGVTPLPAQQHTARFTPWEPSALVTPALRWDDSASLGDYRYEGLAIGGLTLAVLGAWVGSQISEACPAQPGVRCDSDKVGQAIALGLAGAAIGGGLGYLVGRLSPKRPSSLVPDTGPPSPNLASLPDSVRETAGHQHWRGGAIGLAIGGAVGALLGTIARAQCDDCGEQPTRASQALTVGLYGAAGGGLLGFLAGLASPKYVWMPKTAQ
jgi:hypothetical protein